MLRGYCTCFSDYCYARNDGLKSAFGVKKSAYEDSGDSGPTFSLETLSDVDHFKYLITIADILTWQSQRQKSGY